MKLISKIKMFIRDEDSSLTKVAFYYIACQLMVKGMAFITTPVFSRIMSQEEFGLVSNFLAWEAVLFPLITLNLRTTINKSKYDFREDNDSFLKAILTTANFVTVGMYIVVELSYKYLEDFWGLDITYIRLLFMYIVFYTAFDFQQIQFNIFRRYKVYVLYSVFLSVLSVLLSLALVLLFEDKAFGRLVGIVCPVIITSLIIQRNIRCRSKKNKDIQKNIGYIKYALKISIPLVPSALSAVILASSDRIVITMYCGEKQTAMYAIAYTVASIAGIVWTALNQAWSPWFYDNLHSCNYESVKQVSRKFTALYMVFIIGLMLTVPEILWIMGGNDYMQAIWAMPPVILAMVFQFWYAFYFNIEYFFGETYVISIGTLMAAVVNLVLNFIFVPKFGYIAASYTTLVGYIVMLVYHYCIVKIKLKKAFVLNNKFFLDTAVILTISQIVIAYTYNNHLVRFSIIVIYFVILVILLAKYRQKIKNMVISRLKK